MYEFDRYRQTITIEGLTYTSDSFRGNSFVDFSDKSDFHNQLFLFLKDWFSDSPTLIVKTSGSTGVPKEMQVEKERMMQSSRLTCSFLDLQKEDIALLCMPLEYIAGKMMVVRCLIAGLNLYLIPPSGNPLKDLDIPFDFVAMIPLQVYNSLQSEIETKRLKQIKNLIIGGGAIDKELEIQLKDFPNSVYSTYGMTETLSHIALQKINGEDASLNYHPFESVGISLNTDDTLIINAPLVSKDTLYTNDIAEINPDGSFRIIGRKDNIIISGGIKFQIEELEQLLKPYIKGDFAITSLPDPRFGEIIVLLTTEKINLDTISQYVPRYSIPKKIWSIDEIPKTETGKINRAETKELALKLNNKS